MQKLVSVIMPVFNAEKYLRQSIESILNQDLIDFEFIILNDGSNDQSKGIIKSYQDPRIKYLENEQNHGIVYTLNKGLQAANSKYIARMDADDISLPHRLQRQVSFLEQHPEVGVLGTAYLPIDENEKPVHQPIFMPEYPASAKWFMLIGSPLAHPTTMFRTDLVKKVGGYSELFPHAEDYELWTRVSQISNICSLQDVYLHYRATDQNSISKKYFSEQIITTNNIRKLAFERLFDKDISSAISNSIQSMEKGISSRDYFQACLLLHSIYTSMVPNSTISPSKELQELSQIAGNQILIIASRITNPRFILKLIITPKGFSRKQYFKTLYLTNRYRLSEKYRKLQNA